MLRLFRVHTRHKQAKDAMFKPSGAKSSSGTSPLLIPCLAIYRQAFQSGLLFSVGFGSNARGFCASSLFSLFANSPARLRESLGLRQFNLNG